ncbi:hypothetical protein LshimejAT787_1301210 [Lyophyllum shimeji]|uniref:Integral membrane protein n=1 Tax=Lyophyllum shimeji TaxID=47721 RepID=A0A9P3PWC7_LYOSH|nr:hypothetical protein LshimejAT787_1301210 [Lyophyllum shimeji]
MSPPPAPKWPSLYNPGLEILHIEHRNATQPGGAYLYRAADVFRFTLFWTIALYTPVFVLCGTYAFWNLNFPPTPRSDQSYHDAASGRSYPMTPLPHFNKPGVTNRRSKLPKENERRSRLAFAFLVLFAFLSLSVAGAVVGSAVLGFTVFGLYASAHFNMSTWIPFLLAVMQVLTGLLSVWPSIIDII